MGQGTQPPPPPSGNPTGQPQRNPGLPEMAYEYQITRDRWGHVSGEVLIVRGMTEDYFFKNLDAARARFLEQVAFNTPTRSTETVPEDLAAAEEPEKCPACGQTDKGWWDNRTDAVEFKKGKQTGGPNWRCKNESCKHRVYLPIVDPNQMGLPEGE